MIFNIAVAGGGPAGSSLAIRLAQAGFNVSVIERERFPRQKLCGEFISPECFDHFTSLGVSDRMFARGGDRINETIFYEHGGGSVSIPSEWFGSSGALSLSRAEMDLLLLERAKEVGVAVLEATKVVDICLKGSRIADLCCRRENGDSETIRADLVVDATGRSATVQRLLAKGDSQKHSTKKRRPPPLVGFKTHLQGVDLEPGRCEIYSFAGGYGGLSYVEGGLANFCFLIKAGLAKEYGGKAELILNEVISKNKRAAVTLNKAEPVHEWLAVAIDRFGKKELNPASNLFTVGDAAAFIDPFTGSGMLLAFQTAELLADCIAGNRLQPDGIGPAYERAFDRKFSSRLFASGLIRRVSYMPMLATLAIDLLSASGSVREFLTRATRKTFSISPHRR